MTLIYGTDEDVKNVLENYGKELEFILSEVEQYGPVVEQTMDNLAGAFYHYVCKTCLIQTDCYIGALVEYALLRYYLDSVAKFGGQEFHPTIKAIGDRFRATE